MEVYVESESDEDSDAESDIADDDAALTPTPSAAAQSAYAEAEKVLKLHQEAVRGREKRKAARVEGSRIHRLMSLMQKAADRGHAEAQCFIGEQYWQGSELVDKEDQDRGIKWLQMAANQGHLHSIICLGCQIYMDPSTGYASFRESVRWLKRAGRQLIPTHEGNTVQARVAVFRRYTHRSGELVRQRTAASTAEAKRIIKWVLKQDREGLSQQGMFYIAQAYKQKSEILLEPLGEACR